MSCKTLCATAVCGSLLSVGCSSLWGDAARPNVIMIVIDDLGWNDLGCMGSDYYETPNIDALARRGVLFMDNYSACSVSSPSRASILTGKSPARHGITSWIGDPEGELWRKNHKDMLLPASYLHNLSREEYTLAEAMRDGGYATYFVGKWHLGDEVYPTDFGFDKNIAGWAAGGPRGGYFSPYENPMLKDGEAGENLSLRLGAEAVSLIEEGRDGGKPFFLMLCDYAVHGPIQTTEEQWSYYREKAAKMGVEDEGFEAGRRLPVRKAQDNPVYAGLVSQMDQAVGVVLDYLRETGLEQNTIVIFTSDNGGVVSGDSYSTSLAPLRGGKGTQWEGGTRVPLIVYDPREKSGVIETPVIGMDLYPTILDMVGLAPIASQQSDGVSVLPLLRGDNIAQRQLFWHYPHYGNQGGEPSSIVRDGDWKLIYYHEDRRVELYNLTEDLSEQHDLSEREPKRVVIMRKQLDRYLEECGAKMPLFDSMYNEAEGAAWREDRMRKMTKAQERIRKAQLKEGWRPNKDWWGSQPMD